MARFLLRQGFYCGRCFEVSCESEPMYRRFGVVGSQNPDIANSHTLVVGTQCLFYTADQRGVDEPTKVSAGPS